MRDLEKRGFLRREAEGSTDGPRQTANLPNTPESSRMQANQTPLGDSRTSPNGVAPPVSQEADSASPKRIPEKHAATRPPSESPCTSLARGAPAISSDTNTRQPISPSAPVRSEVPLRRPAVPLYSRSPAPVSSSSKAAMQHVMRLKAMESLVSTTSQIVAPTASSATVTPNASASSKAGERTRENPPVRDAIAVPPVPAVPTGSTARARVTIEVDKFFSSKKLSEGELAFENLPARFHSQLVDAFVSIAVDSDVQTAELICSLFRRIASRGLCAPSAWEVGFSPTAAAMCDIVEESPRALRFFIMLLKAAGLHGDSERAGKVLARFFD
ncbi:hypothetical protein OH77DRAFT_1038364 [Trametes cingulata]|nr:hypothetical protein OH77DRAFT_1038364 [Trametes cingulata]